MNTFHRVCKKVQKGQIHKQSFSCKKFQRCRMATLVCLVVRYVVVILKIKCHEFLTSIWCSPKLRCSIICSENTEQQNYKIFQTFYLFLHFTMNCNRLHYSLFFICSVNIFRYNFLNETYAVEPYVYSVAISLLLLLLLLSSRQWI